MCVFETFGHHLMLNRRALVDVRSLVCRVVSVPLIALSPTTSALSPRGNASAAIAIPAGTYSRADHRRHGRCPAPRLGLATGGGSPAVEARISAARTPFDANRRHLTLRSLSRKSRWGRRLRCVAPVLACTVGNSAPVLTSPCTAWKMLGAFAVPRREMGDSASEDVAFCPRACPPVQISSVVASSLRLAGALLPVGSQRALAHRADDGLAG